LGHIGSRLVPALAGSFPDAEVVMIDNRSAQPCCPPSHFALNERIRFVEADVLTADLHALFSGANAVVHLAAIADAAGSFGKEAELERVNLGGARRVAEACVRTGSALAFVSTTSVYGTNAESVDEDCPAIELRPQSPYAASKLRAEQMLRDMTQSDGLQHVVCRFGTIFGPSPGMKFHTAVNKFCRQAVDGAPVTVWRTAMNQQKPYLELGDAVAALLFILRRQLFGGQIYNVLTLNTSVARILQEISAFIPTLGIESVDSPAMSALSFRIERSRIERLGFQFNGTLRQGIGETIEVLRSADAYAMKPATELGP
jgi:nucleoside-diphosphate-sugar epimerase